MNNQNLDLNDIVAKFFSEKPKNKNTIQILPLIQDDNNNVENYSDLDSCITIFEILLNIYLDALCHGNKLEHIINSTHNNFENYYNYILENSYDNISLNNIDKQFLKLPLLWFNSFGFNININEYNDNNNNNNNDDLPSNHYCRVILKINSGDYSYFEFNNIEKPYHFFINGNFDSELFNYNFANLYCLFKNPVNKKVYKISFNYLF